MAEVNPLMSNGPSPLVLMFAAFKAEEILVKQQRIYGLSTDATSLGYCVR